MLLYFGGKKAMPFDENEHTVNITNTSQSTHFTNMNASIVSFVAIS
jgi:hypothetical protein